MSPELRTACLCKAFGWQGGTIHQIAEATGCHSHELLYANSEGVGIKGSDFTRGWLDQDAEAFLCGPLQYWLGVAARVNCAPEFVDQCKMDIL